MASITTTLVSRVKRNVVPHVVIDLNIRNSPAGVAMFKLPNELFEVIFKLLGRQEMEYTLESNHFGPPQLRRVLLCLSLVCKRWSTVANALLFSRAYVTSHESLKLFTRELRELQKRDSTRNYVGTLSYFPPLTQLDADGRAEARRDETKQLMEVLRLCPQVTELQLKTSIGQLQHLVSVTTFQTENLVTLHIANPRTGAGVLNLPYTFPNLRVFIVQKFQINGSSTWPVTSDKLEYLRLIDTSFTFPAEGPETIPEQIANLRRLELINVQYSGNVLKKFLQRSSSSLRYLSLINVGGPDYIEQIFNLAFLTSLRALCMGPHVFKADGNNSTRFPVSLERLTIWELLKPRLKTGTLDGTMSNYDGLEKFLSTSEFAIPNLKTVRIRGADCDWASRKKNLETMCTKAHVSLELSTYKFQTFIEIDLTWQKKMWKNVKAPFNRWA